MMLRFDRLVMHDERHAAIRADLVELYDRPSGRRSTSKARLNPVAEVEPPQFTQQSRAWLLR